MIDIHSHVLPGLDDGPGTVEESLQMLRIAAESGTTDLVATPHANAEFAFDEQRVREVFQSLSEKANGLIRLHLGCDFHLNYQNLQDALANPSKFTINRGRYLLVELPDFVSSSQMSGALMRLLDARLLPIITHPERNPSLQGIDEINGWVESGCFVQVTAQSFLGRFGKRAQKTAEQLVKAGLVHFVASDAHDSSDRHPDLSRAREHVSEVYGEDLADALFVQNPWSVLEGEPVPQRQVPRSKVRRFFSLRG